MGAAADPAVREAEVADADAIGRLLHDFNTEYDEPTPGPRAMARRVSELLEAGEITVLLAGPSPRDSPCFASARPSAGRRSTAIWRSST
jgi:hypothetical protein